MLSKKIRVLNFDSSITKQVDLLEWYKPVVVDLSKIGAECRHWINKKYANQVNGFLAPELRNAITFLGSGDFHHISSLLISQFKDPISVIIFDHHPDWSSLGPRLGCGSWVSQIAKKKNVKKIISFGPSSVDLESGALLTADLKVLKNDQLEIYPYQHKPSKCFLKRVPQNSSIGIKEGLLKCEINWKTLEGKDLESLVYSVFKRIPTRQVYVSIDKDCLKKEYALTNWEEGCLSLDELLAILQMIKNNFEIVGLDILGDYSFPRVKGLIKNFVVRMDHPDNFTAHTKSDVFINNVNQDTNIKLLDYLLSTPQGS